MIKWRTKIPEKIMLIARELRKNHTLSEQVLWNVIRNTEVMSLF